MSTLRRTRSEHGTRKPSMAKGRSLLQITLLALPLAVGGLLFVILNERNADRIATIQERLDAMDGIRQLRQQLQNSLLGSSNELLARQSYLAEDVRLQLDQIVELGGHLDPRTDERVASVRRLLSPPGFVSTRVLSEALDLVGSVTRAETQAQARLFQGLAEDQRREARLGLLALLALTGMLILAIGLWMREQRLQAAVQAASATLLAQHRTLAKAEKLAAVGETAALVAHELRNPLAGALVAVANLRSEATGEHAQRLALIQNEIERVVGRLKSYLEHAKQSPEEWSRVEVADMVNDLATLLRYQIPERIRLATSVREGTRCFVPIDALRQALLNLVMNSVDAIGDAPGQITIVEAGEAGRLELSVEDDGPGFPEEIIARGPVAFDTRKETGTGLGLAIVQRTVRDLGGRLTLANRDGGGASVTMHIPCAEKGGST